MVNLSINCVSGQLIGSALTPPDHRYADFTMTDVALYALGQNIVYASSAIL